MAAGVHHEEGCGALGELEVGGVWEGGGWWVERAVVDVPGVYGGGIGVLPLFVPIVGNFVIVDDVEPWEVFGDSRPVGGGVDLSVLPSIGLGVGAESVGNIDVDEVA